MSYVFSRFEQLKASGALPSPKGVALEILRLTQSDDATSAQLAHVLQADPALAGRLVKFANSTQSGTVRPVVAIGDAVKRLGFAVVRQICLGFSVLNAHRDGRCAGFDYPRFWSRSLATALAAQTLCIKVRVLAPEESFTCGLLADIGSLALASLHPDGFSKVLATGVTGADLSTAEREAFGADHLEFSAALLEDWRLPRICVDAVFHSDRPEQAGFEPGSRERSLCELLSLSRRVGEYFVADLEARKRIVPAMLQRAARIGVDADTLAQMCDSVGEGWQRWGAVLCVATRQPPRLELGDAQDPGAAATPATASTGLTVVSPVPVPAPARVADEVAGDNRPAAKPGSASPPAVPAGEQTATDPAPNSAAPLPALKVQVVSDDRFGSGRLCELLAGYGHQVVLHGDARTALAAALENVPDLMIIDLSGDADKPTGVCATLRATSVGQRLYIIRTLDPVSPAGDGGGPGPRFDSAPVTGMQAGPDDYLGKPVDRVMLDLRLRAARRTIALREALQREQDDLRRLASELAIANRRLQRAAFTDSLTGLPNRRYGLDRLEQEWSASTRSQRPLSCMMIEIDHFRQFSTSHGHVAGDRALGLAAAVLRESARASDVICRMGGEEFLVISPDTDRAAAMKSAERLRTVVDRRLGAESGAVLPAGGLTLSIGVATRDGSVLGYEALLRLSGEALGMAKLEGRNRVRVASTPVTPLPSGIPASA